MPHWHTMAHHSIARHSTLLGTPPLAPGRPSYQARINRIKETLKLLCPRDHNETAAYKIYVKSQLWIKFSSSDVFCEYPSFSFLFANFRPG